MGGRKVAPFKPGFWDYALYAVFWLVVIPVFLLVFAVFFLGAVSVMIDMSGFRF